MQDVVLCLLSRPVCNPLRKTFDLDHFISFGYLARLQSPLPLVGHLGSLKKTVPFIVQTAVGEYIIGTVN